MPQMDGLEMVRRLREMEDFVETPVVMISCRDDIAARNRALELGVLFWLKKPFRISELQFVVENGLSGVEVRHANLIDKIANGYS
jgi:DNA-binding response OmpR family regulator